MATNPSISEVFDIEPDFLRQYNTILNRHWSGNVRYALGTLLDDITKYFNCVASAIVVVGPNNQPKPLEVCPPEQNQVIEALIKTDVIRNYLCQDILGDELTGKTFGPVDEVTETDIIPVPEIQGSTPVNQSACFFVLLDGATLATTSNCLAERNHQRRMLSQFLISWWARAFAPKVGLVDEGSYDGSPGKEDKQPTMMLPAWLHTATLAQLITKAIYDARYIRHTNESSVERRYFREES